MVIIDTTSSAAAASPSPPTEVIVCPFTVLVDTREQQPWTFTSMIIGGKQWIVPRKIATLATGDYSIDGYQSRWTIERKSADDVVGSVGAGHKRFENEHQRMLEMVESGGAACVIVEGCLSQILHELETDGRLAARNTLMGCVRSWPFKYRVPWFFAGDRRCAEILAIQILLKWWETVSVSLQKGA